MNARTCLIAAIAAAAVALPLARSQEPPAKKPPRLLAVRGGTVLPVIGPPIEDGVVLCRDGKIAAVGKASDLSVPEGAETVDARGQFVMPGIVDMHSHMGVYSWPDVPANADGNECTDPITPHVRAEDAIWPQDPQFALARAGGVTCVQVIPGSGNLIGGEGVVIKLRPAHVVAEMKLAGAPRQLKMALGENPKRVYGEKKQVPTTRMGNAAVLREAFDKAKEYSEKWARYREKKERFEAKVAERKRKKDAGEKVEGEDPEEPDPPSKDPKLETLAAALRGELRIHCHIYRADEILWLFELAKERGFKIASLQHCLEGYKVAKEIAAAGAGVATFADWWGYKVEAFDAIPHNAGLLARAGVRVAIHSDSGDLVQRLPHEVAKTLKYGMPEEEALKAITLNPAWMLGVDARIGSIEVGKDADLAVFSKHPLSVYALCTTTVIDGEVVWRRPAKKDY